MVELPGIVIEGAIRSKKTSQQIITIPARGARRCRVCGKMPGFPKIIPSDAHKVWHGYAMAQCEQIKAVLWSRGIVLPIQEEVNVEALFYQDVDRADATGLYESLGDLLQDAQILLNDRLISSWDGSRRLKDAQRPRVEVFITVLQEKPKQQDLLLLAEQR